MKLRSVLIVLTVFFLWGCGAKEARVLKLATTTSTYETGILGYVLKPFEERNNVRVDIISVGTGKALELGRNGDVDIVLVHAYNAELAFVESGYGVKRFDVMYNDFVFIGPEHDPSGVRDAQDITEVLNRLLAGKNIFVSRGDESGTHKKEQELWEKAGLADKLKSNRNYIEVGQGMSQTIRVADEKFGYTLADRGTFYALAETIQLVIVGEGFDDLNNPYGIIAVHPERHPHVNKADAEKLIAWFVSDECQKMINDFTVQGKQLFFANAKK